MQISSRMTCLSPVKSLSTAVDLYQAMEMTFWLPETAAALTQVEA